MIVQDDGLTTKQTMSLYKALQGSTGFIIRPLEDLVGGGVAATCMVEIDLSTHRIVLQDKNHGQYGVCRATRKGRFKRCCIYRGRQLCANLTRGVDKQGR